MVPREGVRPPRLGLEAQAPDSPDEAYWRSREESNLRIPPSQGRRQIRWREHDDGAPCGNCAHHRSLRRRASGLADGACWYGVGESDPYCAGENRVS